MCFNTATLERSKSFMAWQLGEWHIEALANAIVVPEAAPEKVLVFDVSATNLKDVEVVSFKEMKFIATELINQPDLMAAMEHQTQYWAEKTGHETDFTWATNILSDWEDGTVDRMSENWMHKSLAAARVVQSQINLYRRYLSWSETISKTVDAVEEIVKTTAQTVQQRKKAEARARAKARHASGGSRPDDVARRGRK